MLLLEELFEWVGGQLLFGVAVSLFVVAEVVAVVVGVHETTGEGIRLCFRSLVFVE